MNENPHLLSGDEDLERHRERVIKAAQGRSGNGN